MECATRAPRVLALISADITITWYPRGVLYPFVAHRRAWGGGEVERERVGEVQVLPASVPSEYPAHEGACAVTRNRWSSPGTNASCRDVPELTVSVLSELSDSAEVALAGTGVE